MFSHTTVSYVVGVSGEQVPVLPEISTNTLIPTEVISVALDVSQRVSQNDKPKTQKVSLVKDEETEDVSLLTQTGDIIHVPFFSQFKDITATKWRKVGCGVASLAMLIDYYKPGEVTVDTLLNEGLDAGAYLSDAGWIHQGLVNLADDHGLSGSTHDASSSTMDSAFAQLKDAVGEGPVIASVHYTFNPKSTIPHLVVIRGVKDDMVYYSDPSESSGNGSISVDAFKKSWKKRYIEVRPA